MPTSIAAAAVLAILSLTTAARVAKADPTVDRNPPLVLFIMADDMGYADTGYNGRRWLQPGQIIPTPTLDRLANEGVVLETYVTETLCSPARAALLTGRHGFRSGITGPLCVDSPAHIPPSFTTLSEAFRSRGFYTAISGKWHVGSATNSSLPRARGFDSAYGSYGHALNFYERTLTEFKETVYDYRRDGAVVHEEQGGYNTDLTTDEAIRQIRLHAAHTGQGGLGGQGGQGGESSDTFDTAGGVDTAGESGAGAGAQSERGAGGTKETEAGTTGSRAGSRRRGTFLYVAYNSPHDPLQAPPDNDHNRLCDHISHEWRRLFCTMVVSLDAAVQRLIDEYVIPFIVITIFVIYIYLIDECVSLFVSRGPVPVLVLVKVQCFEFSVYFACVCVWLCVNT
jgi:hypothetical protein